MIVFTVVELDLLNWDLQEYRKKSREEHVCIYGLFGFTEVGSETSI